MYSVSEQIIDFFEFVMIGILISLIFDFFRAYRNVNKKRSGVISVMFQDILYFLIATVIIILGIIYILDSSLRIYVFLAIFLGICVYTSLLSSIFVKIYSTLIKKIICTIKFTFLPFNLILQITRKTYSFFKKNIKKCCKKIFYMVSFKCKVDKSVEEVDISDKRGLKNIWKIKKKKVEE